MENPESIVDLLNGEAKYLSKHMPTLIRSEEIFIEKNLPEPSKKGARYQLICRVVQDITANYLSPENKDRKVDGKPVPSDFFEVAKKFYDNKYAKKAQPPQ
jgi:hypothetical protein